MWYRQGQQEQEAGDMDAAIESFRKATTNDLDNQDYRLALGRALASQGSEKEALGTLLQLRQSAPENGELNLEVARLTADTGNIREATRFYHSALYGVWPIEQADKRRREVRAELIEYLLDNGDTTTALSELLAFTPDIRDTAKERTQAGQWFLKVGDASRALEQFTRALQLEPNNLAALDGAGEAEFRLGSYSKAVAHLEAALREGEPSESRDHLLAVSRGVLADDPLDATISNSQRVSRLRRLLETWRSSIHECIQTTGEGSAGSVMMGLEMEAEVLEPGLTVRALERDTELVRRGLELFSRMERAATQSCGPAGDAGEVLELVIREHGLENE